MEDGSELKWDFATFRAKLESQGYDHGKIFADIEDTIVKTILSVEPLLTSGISMFLKNKTCCFELFGFDIMLDSK